MTYRRPSWSWVRTVEPLRDPITVSEAKQQTRFTQSNDDALFTSYIKAATGAAEDYMNRGLYTQTWQYTVSNFYEMLYLPMAAPLQSVTTVEYYDTTGALQTLNTSLYLVDTTTKPGRITRAPNQVWPTVQADRWTGRVRVTYIVGWPSIDSIPERIKQGLRLYIGYLTADREGLEPNAEQALRMAQACWDDRVSWIEPTSTYPYYAHWRALYEGWPA